MVTLKNFIPTFIAAGALALVGCSPSSSSESTSETTGKDSPPTESQTINVDGSSTVYVISSRLAEDFNTENPKINVNVAISGTGGGFKKFCAGETDIQDASRPITTEEDAEASKNGVKYYELPVGYDGLTVVVNKSNTWVDHFTVAELKMMWEADSKVKTWKDIRPTWPDKPIGFYSPDSASGTFDFFTEVICGKKGNTRSDANQSSDDNQIVKGVSGDENSIGYFGMAYYEENMGSLRAVAVDNGAGPIEPSKETVANMTYMPLSRPEFIYVSAKAADRPEVKAFVEYYLGSKGQAAIGEVGYVPFSAETYDRIAKIFSEKKDGTHFSGMTGKKVEDVLTAAGL